MLYFVDLVGECVFCEAVLHSSLAQVDACSERDGVFSIEQQAQPGHELYLASVADLDAEFLLRMVVA